METPRFSTDPDPSYIRRAVREHRLVEFYYLGELVTVEPYVFGIGKRYRSPVLLAWDAVNGWREYSSVRIRRLTVLNRRYVRSRRDYDPEDPRIKEVDTAAEVIGRKLDVC